MNNTDIYLQDKFIRTRLANIRKSKGITQKQLSDMTGLSLFLLQLVIWSLEKTHIL